MKNTFTLFDIVALKETFENASIAHDGLPRFLNRYAFEDVYETQDDSIVFQAGGKNDIEIEFFNFNHPYKRSCLVHYMENGNFEVLEFGTYCS